MENIIKVPVIMMCGIAGSGKDTAIKELIANHPEYNFSVISRDKIRFSLLKDDEDYFAHEDEVLRVFISTIKKEISRIKSLPAEEASKNVVIINSTNLTATGRKKLLNKIHMPCKYIAYVIKVPTSVAIEQNANRTGRERVPTKTIFEMSKRFKLPSTEEGFEEIYIKERGE